MLISHTHTHRQPQTRINTYYLQFLSEPFTCGSRTLWSYVTSSLQGKICKKKEESKKKKESLTKIIWNFQRILHCLFCDGFFFFYFAALFVEFCCGGFSSANSNASTPLAVKTIKPKEPSLWMEPNICITYTIRLNLGLGLVLVWFASLWLKSS